MPNPYFRFKQFAVYQDRCAMKVGTDGVLLGAWAECSKAKQILDIGTGTGLIALMLAQRNPTALIDAVEIDANAALQAGENIRQSPWANRITVRETSFQKFEAKVKYNLIVSNPPYFQHSLKPPEEGRGLARHTDTLPFDELISGAKALLAEDGQLNLILPFDEGNRFIQLAAGEDLFCTQKTLVIPQPGANPKRMLLSFGLKNSPCHTAELLIETGTRHAYSEQYKELTKDFYLEK